MKISRVVSSLAAVAAIAGGVVATAPAQAAPTATLKLGVGVTPSFTHQGLEVKVTGAVREPAGARPLVLQGTTDGGKVWRNIGGNRWTDAKGNITVKLTATVTTAYRWYYGGDATYRAAISGSVRPVIYPKLASYPNCAALNRHYPHGVGYPGVLDRTTGAHVLDYLPSYYAYYRNDYRTVYTSPTQPVLYPSNPTVYPGEKDLDADNDGIACEKL